MTDNGDTSDAVMPDAPGRDDDRERLRELAAQLSGLGERWVGAVDELVPIAEGLVHLEACRRVAEGRLDGSRRAGPSSVELAVIVLHARIGCLRPEVPFVTGAAGNAAADLLVTSRHFEGEE